jgi:hypothetical protein
MWRLYGGGWHSVTELTPALPHSSRTMLRMAAQGGLAEQRRDTIPRRCQGAGVATFAFDSCARVVPTFNSLVGGVGAGAASSGRPRAMRRFARGGVQPSSEAEILPRGRPALERGGDSPEGASIPRVRRRSAREVWGSTA